MADADGLTPLKAIRLKCLDCCLGSSHEVRLCPCKDCPHYPYRFGRRPKGEKAGVHSALGDKGPVSRLQCRRPLASERVRVQALRVVPVPDGKESEAGRDRSSWRKSLTQGEVGVCWGTGGPRRSQAG